MATKTPNFNLTKPDMTDYADIRVINTNMDIIDRELKAISKLAQQGTGGGSTPSVDLSDYALKSELGQYLPLSGGALTGMITINGKEVALKTTTKTGTTKGNESDHWKTYLPDGRVMFKVTVGSQTVVTLPVRMANDQYSVILCDEYISGEDYYYVTNRGISNKTVTGFNTWQTTQINSTSYMSGGWTRRYSGGCEAIIIGWEA